ncbi:MAG: DUF3006 domain-containing protein [Clostridia bacterium]|nr:DUF3006 domain-containing protein [Clostridia bacterium]
MMQYSVDRFEGELAILIDDHKTIAVPKNILPEETKEGDILIRVGEKYKIDHAYTEKMRKEAAELIDQLFE